MRINRGFSAWNRPYLFQAMEATLSSFSPEERADIISLGIGDPDLPTPEPIREAIIREHRSRYHGYPTAQGRLDVRTALAEHYYRRFNVNIDPSMLFIGPGAKSDLFDLNAVFSNPGDTVIILDPAYPVYRDAAEYRGNRIHYLSGSVENNYQPPLPPDGELDHLALVYLCYPNNPTGVTASRTYVAEAVELAQRHGAMVIMDIAYADFIPGNGRSDAFSIFDIPGGDAVGIEVGSFSKPFSMTGDRLSWVAIKNPKAAAFWHRYRSNRDSGVSNYDQAGGLAALVDPAIQAIQHKNFAVYGRRARILRDGLQTLGYPMIGLDNTPYAWFSIPIQDDLLAAHRFLTEARVIVTAGSGFGPAGRGFLRATLFQPEERLQEAILRMQSIRLMES
ncbi:pyridoxal phosphate-dependent aminotransferase [bacterium]|nr:pyridoxal phosphate-dependent aminotransferase [candidate division CSSED10-310 bacterium]